MVESAALANSIRQAAFWPVWRHELKVNVVSGQREKLDKRCLQRIMNDWSVHGITKARHIDFRNLFNPLDSVPNVVKSEV
jgi:hypothetical protein